MAGNKSNKNRKYGKNLKDPSMKAYAATGRKEKNKLKKLDRHIRESVKKMFQRLKKGVVIGADIASMNAYKRLTGKTHPLAV